MKKTVVVTAIGSFAASAVIAGCRREGYRVVGCDIYPAEWVASSLDVDVFYQAPYATDAGAYRTFLQKVCSQEQAELLLPLTDVEVDALHAWPEAGQALGVVIAMSGPETIALCRNKEKMAQFLAERGLCETIPGRRLSRVPETEYESLTYPLVLKPVDGRSSQGLRVIAGPEQMALAAVLCRADAARYLVQPKIDGSVVTVDVVRDAASGDCVCLPRRELLRTLNGAGTSVQVFRDRALEAQCRAIAEALDIRGCVNFEFIERVPDACVGDRVDCTSDACVGNVGESAEAVSRYFLECNPRFAGGVAFSCMAGYDMIQNHLNCFLGRGIEPMGDICDQYIARRYTEYRMKEENQ